MRVRQLHRLHPQLLSERLRKLIVGDQAHVFSDLTQQRARTLLLLV